MISGLQRIAAVLLAILWFVSPLSAQGKRVALVIGNGDYKHTTRLANPKNDADDIAGALQKLGFSVLLGRDLDKASLDRKVRDFAQALSGAEVGLFFYAGHGLQVGGQNYLVPIDAELNSAPAIDFELLRLDLVHRTMERETRTNILIMDACRDNPLARNLARALGTRSAQIGRGLASIESGEGSLISFSTQPGNVALDGTGRNSPFAAALLKHLPTPGDDLPSILINVRNDVMQATGRRQVPWEHSAMTARFFFTPPKAGPQEVELEFWASVKDSKAPAVLRTYLDRYPDGEFAPIARTLIDHYDRQLKAEIAEREEARRRQEEERITAAVRRIEEERRQREAVLTEERKRAEEAKNASEAKLVEDKQRAEWLTQTEELRKLTEQMRQSSEALAAAERQRLHAVKQAEDAKKAAEQAIADKRDAEKNPGAQRLAAALPKLEKPAGPTVGERGRFDGTWQIHRVGASCRRGPDVKFAIHVANGQVSGRWGGGPISGTASAAGVLTFKHLTSGGDGSYVQYTVHLSGNSGSGTFGVPGQRCQGSLTLEKG
jgi:uncharacterized caspase-like protein